MATAKAMALRIGRAAIYTTPNGLKVAVQVSDVRVTYGKLQCEVTPLAGSGTCWLNDTALTYTPALPDGAA